jgi:hypothetical protein
MPTDVTLCLTYSAMNTIVTSRAGKDLVSSLCSGLLTIGSRFGGALDEAAVMFSEARDKGLTPREFVDESRQANKLSKSGHFQLLFRVCLTYLYLHSQRYWPQD